MGLTPLPRWIELQLFKLVEKAPTGPNWVHQIKFDGYRMAARLDRGKASFSRDRASTGRRSIRRPPPLSQSWR
jgi:ATP-dependent DNA ligase